MEVNANFSPRAREDYRWVLNALNGNQSSFANLLDRYRDPVYFMILKMVHNRDDADDLTMEAFGKAFNNLERYRPDYAFSTWLFKIAVNNSIDFLRKRRLETMSIHDSSEEDKEGATLDIHSKGLDPEERFIKNERKRLTHEVVDKLKPKYRLLIELRYFKELSYEEISQELDIPVGTIKAQLYRAKELLFNILTTLKRDY